MTTAMTMTMLVCLYKNLRDHIGEHLVLIEALLIKPAIFDSACLEFLISKLRVTFGLVVVQKYE